MGSGVNFGYCFRYMKYTSGNKKNIGTFRVLHTIHSLGREQCFWDVFIVSSDICFCDDFITVVKVVF